MVLVVPARPPPRIPAVMRPPPVVERGIQLSQVPFNTIDMIQVRDQPEKTEVPKTPLITEHPEDVRLQIPEEQPL